MENNMAKATITISYKSLPLKARLCFKPVRKADGNYTLACRWWYAIYMGVKMALNAEWTIEDTGEK